MRHPIILLLLLSCFAAQVAFGTAQFPDKIRIKDEDVPLLENPLDYLWTDAEGTPLLFSETRSSENITKDAIEYLNGRPAVFSKEGIMSTASWRGYVATWEVKEDKLFLIKLQKDYYRERPKQEPETNETTNHRDDREYRDVPLSKVIPGKKLPVFADWFSGKLRIPHGKQLRYVHMGYGSQYERETFIHIVKGKVTARSEIDNTTSENQYRSEPDLGWCALGVKAVDKQDWMDARLLNSERINPLLESGQTFKTRGIFFSYSKEDIVGRLVIFDTPKTKAASFALNQIPEKNKTPEGSHVEIEAHFVKSGEEYKLHVISIRDLAPGETMHAPDFPQIWKQMQSEASPPQAGENAPHTP